MKLPPNIFLLLAWLCIITWIGLILYGYTEYLGWWGPDIGIWPSLQQSNLARAMFLDIGVMSTIFAGWIVFATPYRWRWVFAAGSMVLGSFFLLPYLAYYFKEKHDHRT